jgi:hypothetical protein
MFLIMAGHNKYCITCILVTVLHLKLFNHDISETGQVSVFICMEEGPYSAGSIWKSHSQSPISSKQSIHSVNVKYHKQQLRTEIQFTMETEPNNDLHFMDTLVTKTALYIEVCRKSTHTESHLDHFTAKSHEGITCYKLQDCLGVM